MSVIPKKPARHLMRGGHRFDYIETEKALELGEGFDAGGRAPPYHLMKAVEAVKTLASGASCEKSILRYHARLWIFGDAVGAACWRKGYDACRN